MPTIFTTVNFSSLFSKSVTSQWSGTTLVSLSPTTPTCSTSRRSSNTKTHGYGWPTTGPKDFTIVDSTWLSSSSDSCTWNPDLGLSCGKLWSCGTVCWRASASSEPAELLPSYCMYLRIMEFTIHSAYQGNSLRIISHSIPNQSHFINFLIRFKKHRGSYHMITFSYIAIRSSFHAKLCFWSLCLNIVQILP